MPQSKKLEARASVTLTDVVAARVRLYRKRRGLSQAALVEEMDRLGHPMERGSLSKLESGKTRADNVTLREILVLAAALAVPPPLLFLPLGDDVDIYLTPTTQVDPLLAFRWLCGETPFGHIGADGLAYADNVREWTVASEPIRLYRELYRLQLEAGDASWRVKVDGPEAQGKFDVALRELMQHRNYMSSVGQDPLWLAPEWVERASELGLVDEAAQTTEEQS